MNNNAWPGIALSLAIAGPAQAADPPREFEFRLAPGKSEEICMPLQKGEGFEFTFRSDAPVDFNVHYHVGAKVLMPYEAPRVQRQTNRFVAPAANTFCMMWTAPKQAEAGVLGRWQPLDNAR